MWGKGFLHLVKILAHLDSPNTQVSQAELAALLSYSVNANVIVELGTFEGRTSVALARNTSGTVYSVDIFPVGKLGFCISEAIAKIGQRRAGAFNLHFIKGESSRAAATFPTEIDFLFIDANHTYEAVGADWSAWFPKVRSGGIVAMHDAITDPPSGSSQFYDEVVRACGAVKEIESVESLVILRKFF